MAWVWGAAGFPILLPVGQPGPQVPGHTVCAQRQCPEGRTTCPGTDRAQRTGVGAVGSHMPWSSFESVPQVREWCGASPLGAPHGETRTRGAQRGKGSWKGLLASGGEGARSGKTEGDRKEGEMGGDKCAWESGCKGCGVGGSHGAGERAWWGLGSLPRGASWSV